MNQHKQKTYCKKYNSCNTRKENFQMKEMRPKCGRLMETIEHFSCCSAPIAAPKCTVDACDKTVFYKEDFFTRPKDQCANPRLTQYGKEFVAGTGKMITECACIKFNGLQDTCKHPSCFTKVGCLDDPFPNCEPAQKWKSNYICKNNRKCFS